MKENNCKKAQINPNSPTALNNLGNILSKKIMTRMRNTVTEKAISIKSDFSLAYNNLASLLSKQGNFIEAKNLLKKLSILIQNLN